MRVPYSDKIDWGFPRPWGGGAGEGERSIRIYYGTHAKLIPTCPALTRADIAWVLVDDQVDPSEYDWEFIWGSDAWLWPIGWSPSTYSKKLIEHLRDQHTQYVYKVNGYDADTLKLIEAGEMLIADAGKAELKAKHKYL